MHALGLKDLYRSNQTSAVYYMSLMAKHLTPIGQYISVKERESLGWLDNNQIKTIDKNGTYTLYPASAQNEVVAYKRICRTEKLFIWNIVNLMTMVTNMIQKQETLFVQYR